MTFRLTATAAALALSAASAGAAPVSLNLIGSTTVPRFTEVEGVAFGGISGLQMASDGTYYALSDDRGNAGRPPRFYTLDLDYDLSGFHDVTILSQTALQDTDGSPLPTDAATVDPEGLRLAPNGNLYVSSEGNFSADPAALKQPFVREYTTSGEYVRDLAYPSGYDYVDSATDGARNNQLFEALAVDAEGTVYVGNEGPLIPDGGYSTETEGSVVRIAEIDPDAGPVAQYAYELPAAGTTGAPGLVDLLAYGDGFLALERSYLGGYGNTVSIVYTEILPSTTDILALDALVGESYVPMSREVLVTLTDPFMGIDNDNLEAMSFGKVLENGNLSLVLAADNNFSAGQNNLFVAFEVAPTAASVPLPAGLPLLLSALGGIAVLRRR